MIPRNQQNRKVQIPTACPTCGLDLAARATAGFTRNGETYCCEGCAKGSGCTCERPGVKRRLRPRGAIVQREPRGRHHAEEARDRGAQPETSARKPLAPRSRAQSTQSRYPSRKAGARIAPKRKRNLTKERDSTREQARGRSEFTGSLTRGGANRIAKTGTKSRGT